MNGTLLLDMAGDGYGGPCPVGRRRDGMTRAGCGACRPGPAAESSMAGASAMVTTSRVCVMKGCPASGAVRAGGQGSPGTLKLPALGREQLPGAGQHAAGPLLADQAQGRDPRRRRAHLRDARPVPGEVGGEADQTGRLLG